MIKLKDILFEGTKDHEGKMAKSQLERSMKYSKMIYNMIDNVGQSGEVEMPAWVQSKLTKSMDYLQSVFNYLDGKDGLEDKFQTDSVDELSEKCWKGYEKKGMKTMFGKKYPNCVKKEEKLTESSDTFVNILTRFGFKKGARDWGGHQFFVHKSKDLYATYHPASRSLVIEPKRGGKPVFDSARSNFSIRALLQYLESPKNKFVSTEGKLTEKIQKYVVASTNGTLFSGDKGVTEKQALKIMDRYEKVGMNLFMLGVQYWNKPHKYNKKKIMVKEGKKI